MLINKSKIFTKRILPLTYTFRYKRPKDRLPAKKNLKPNIPTLNKNNVYSEEEKIDLWKKARYELEPPYIRLSHEEKKYLANGYLDNICIPDVTIKKTNKNDVDPNEAPFNEIYEDSVGEGNFTKAYNLLEKDPKRWFWVERLIPKKLYNETFNESSIFPPNIDEPPNLTYFIARTRNNLLPVYKVVEYTDQKARTVIRKIDGDIWALEEEIRTYLEKLHNQRILSSVNEISGEVKFMGNYVIDVYNHLVKLGF